MKPAIACCSIRAVVWSDSDFSWRTTSTSAAGTAIQPSRRAGRERLGGRAGVDDAVRVEPLQRADGGAVVAVLRVVVVLDRDGVVLAQPLDERAPALRGEHDARRVLVGRRQHDRPGARALERADDEPGAVDRHGHRLEPGARGDRPLLGRARVLDRDPPHAARGERAADEPEALDVAAGDHDPRRLGHHPAHAPEVVGERDAQRLDAAGVAVDQVGVGDRGHGVAQAARPRAPRERGHVGPGRAEVEARARARLSIGIGAAASTAARSATRGCAPWRSTR